MSQEREGYGIHQDPRHSSGHPGGNCLRCIQVLNIEGQERVETVAGAIPERHVWHDGCKPAILLEVRQEFDGYCLCDQSI
jgi:hypothetical protein